MLMAGNRRLSSVETFVKTGGDVGDIVALLHLELG
jgi:hypothetical protein